MPEYRWKPQYELGIEAIDSQHRLIMDKFNLLYAAVIGKEGREAIIGLMTEVLECAQTHFQDEEALFAKHRYPKETEQKKAHQAFRMKSEAIYASFLQNAVVNPLELVALLADWIENHMLTMDMEYKEFMLRLELLNRLAGKR